MGRIVNLKNYITGEMIPSFVSVDKVTNELVSMRASSIQIPDEIKDVKLSKEQQQALREGKGIFLENMISNRKNPFSATDANDYFFCLYTLDTGIYACFVTSVYLSCSYF